MKSQINITDILPKVITKCFDKFAIDQADLAGFIDFLVSKINVADAEDIEGFKKEIEESITSKDDYAFESVMLFANLDYESLQHINLTYDMKIDELSVASQEAAAYPVSHPGQAAASQESAEISRGLYHDLVFVFGLPQAFSSSSTEQKTRINSIWSLLGKEGDPFANVDYSTACRSMKKGLFARALKNLLPGNQDATFFLLPLSVMLGKVTDNESLKDQILEAASGFVGALCRQRLSAPKIKSGMVSKGLAKSVDDLFVEINDTASANDTYIVTNKKNGKRYYAKTFDSTIALEGGIPSPLEMFIYPVMQYLGLGPEAEFLFEPNSSIFYYDCENNFILTRDVRGAGQEFFLDIEENKTNLTKLAVGDGSDAATRKFAVEISAAAALVDILSITDVFGKNGRNYGLVASTTPDATKQSEYKFQFIDYWPSENGLFTRLKESEKQTYSPRNSLFKKHPSKANGSKNLSPLTELALATRKSSNSGFAKAEIQDDVYQRLFRAQSNGKTLLEDAISQARDDVVQLILGSQIENDLELLKADSQAKDDFGNLISEKVAFTRLAITHLDNYIKRITKNIGTYHLSTSRDFGSSRLGP
jgi:hypothetical protein